MFDLEKSVNSWRTALPESIRQRAELVEELEQHVRDDFDGRVAAGAQAPDAWAAAVEAFGSTKDLAGEFARGKRQVWMPARLVNTGFALVVVSVISLGFIAFGLRNRPLLAAHVVLITAGYCAVLAAGALAIVAVITRAISGWSHRQQESFHAAARRLAMLAAVATFAGVALGAVWGHIHLGRWWGWDDKEVGGACVLVWSLVLIRCFGAGSSLQGDQGPMLLGVIGNIVVALGWFGPVVFSQSHSYGAPSMVRSGSLGVFLIAHMCLVYLALLPARVLRKSRDRREVVP